MKGIERIFKGFFYEFAKWLFVLFISFSLIIQNVTFLPNINNNLVRIYFVVSTMGIGIFMAYYSLRFPFIGLEQEKKKSK